MRRNAAIIVALVALASLFFSTSQLTTAQYYSYDGTVDKHVTKKVVEPLKGKKDWWTYLVEVCATDRNLGVAEVILRSDMERGIHQWGDKVIPKGKCVTYGAVMKANDGSTLGAELIETHEAVQKMQELREHGKTASDSKADEYAKEYNWLKWRVGFGA